MARWRSGDPGGVLRIRPSGSIADSRSVGGSNFTDAPKWDRNTYIRRNERAVV